MRYQEVIQFWFENTDPKKWFTSADVEFDSLIREKFLRTYCEAVRGELFLWRGEPLGRLAEIIVIDQFSRNMFRNSPESFAYDPIALTLAQEAVHLGISQRLTQIQKPFLIMPYMHSESKIIHEEAVKLFTGQKLTENLDFEMKHKKIIDRFGRFPHRNKVLGRESTPEEIEFLKQPGSHF